MAFGVSSPQYILHCRCGLNQARVPQGCRFENNVGYRSVSLIKSFRSLVPSSHSLNQGHGIRRDYSIRAAERSKSGFGRQPVKKNKKVDRPQPKKEEDRLARAQQILEKKQQSNETAMPTVAEQAPALDVEETEEKKKVTAEDDFEERLAQIRREAKEQKASEEYKKFLPIDYDAPLPSPPEDAKWTDSISARIGIGVAAVVFALIFTLGDFLPSDSPSKDSSKQQVEQPQLPPEEAAKLKAQAEKFDETLKTSPEDRDALEGAGVTYAELGEYSKSATYLTKLVQKVPNDVEAQRLLGEVRYEAGDYAGSATAYRSAIRAVPKDTISLLQGLVSALLADNKPSEAVGEMLTARTRLSEASQSKAASSGAESGSNAADDQMDPVQVEMLLGKAYSTWEGHTGDAIAVYDNIIASHPDDFRGYLAKGILLKDQGKDGDAERMFIQARYLAPPKAKGFVDRYSGR